MSDRDDDQTRLAFGRVEEPLHVERFAAAVRTRTREEWCAALEPLGACFAPVLSLDEAPGHVHAQARDAWVPFDRGPVPAPAPRFSRTPSRIGAPAVDPGVDSRDALAAWGVGEDRVAALVASGAVGVDD